jgi:hypothetical protein
VSQVAHLYSQFQGQWHEQQKYQKIGRIQKIAKNSQK